MVSISCFLLSWQLMQRSLVVFRCGFVSCGIKRVRRSLLVCVAASLLTTSPSASVAFLLSTTSTAPGPLGGVVPVVQASQHEQHDAVEEEGHDFKTKKQKHILTPLLGHVIDVVRQKGFLSPCDRLLTLNTTTLQDDMISSSSEKTDEDMRNTLTEVSDLKHLISFTPPQGREADVDQEMEHSFLALSSNAFLFHSSLPEVVEGVVSAADADPSGPSRLFAEPKVETNDPKRILDVFRNIRTGYGLDSACSAQEVPDHERYGPDMSVGVDAVQDPLLDARFAVRVQRLMRQIRLCAKQCQIGTEDDRYRDIASAEKCIEDGVRLLAKIVFRAKLASGEKREIFNGRVMTELEVHHEFQSNPGEIWRTGTPRIPGRMRVRGSAGGEEEDNSQLATKRTAQNSRSSTACRNSMTRVNSSIGIQAAKALTSAFHEILLLPATHDQDYGEWRCRREKHAQILFEPLLRAARSSADHVDIGNNPYATVVQGMERLQRALREQHREERAATVSAFGGYGEDLELGTTSLRKSLVRLIAASVDVSMPALEAEAALRGLADIYEQEREGEQEPETPPGDDDGEELLDVDGDGRSHADAMEDHISSSPSTAPPSPSANSNTICTQASSTRQVRAEIASPRVLGKLLNKLSGAEQQRTVFKILAEPILTDIQIYGTIFYPFFEDKKEIIYYYNKPFYYSLLSSKAQSKKNIGEQHPTAWGGRRFQDHEDDDAGHDEHASGSNRAADEFACGVRTVNLDSMMQDMMDGDSDEHEIDPEN